VGAHGTVYIESNALNAARITRAWTLGSGGGRPAVNPFWLVQRGGDLRAAIPVENATSLGGFFFGDVLYGRSRLGRLLAPAAAWLARRGALRHLLPSRALVLRRGRARTHPFYHMVALAKRHGVDLSRHEAGLLARGSYDSNKVALYFVDPSKRGMDVIVKMTRTAGFNERLDTEYRALRRLAQYATVRPGSYPEALFLDVCGSLSVLGQKVVAGAPFRARTTSRPDCPVASDGIAWIAQLGKTSAAHRAITAADLSARFVGLLDQLARVYSLTDGEHDFLHARVHGLATWGGTIPAVFRHGDAGTWNILVSEGGRSAFLDWESAEHAGPPLWDLFDFIRSFGTWIGRTRGERDTTAIYEAAFLRDGPLAALQRDAVGRYCADVNVPGPAIEPLFYACWMQRALREAAWATTPLERGTYIKLLRLCIHGRHQPGLRWTLG
jgi:Phosphotransferase enzyme family